MKRMLAFLGDFILLTTVYVILFYTIGIVFFMTAITESIIAIILFYVIYTILYIAYFCILPYFWDGKTVAKRSMGIRINTKDRDWMLLIKLFVKYFIVRFLLTILTFGVIIIVDLIHMKVTDGQFLTDRLLKLDVISE